MKNTSQRKNTRKTRAKQSANRFGKNGASLPKVKKVKRQKGLSDAELQRLTVERRKRYQPITRAMPQPMSHEAYYGRAGQVVNLITHAGTEACPESLLAQFLVGFGSIIGRGPYRYQAGLHHLNEFVVLVGESGIGCKGTSWNAVLDLLAQIDPAWYPPRVYGGFQSGEAIIHKVRDDHAYINKAGKRIVIPGVSDKRLLIMEEEFGRILIVANREGNTLSTTLRDCWDGLAKLSTASKNDPQEATEAHIAMVAHITPTELHKHSNEVDATNGFFNRIIWLAVQAVAEVPIPPRVDWAQTKLLAELQSIVQNFQSLLAGNLDLSMDARLFWRRHYRRLKRRAWAGLIGPIVKRSLAHTLRFAMLYTVLDNSRLIEIKHLRAAIALVEYAERSAQWAFREKTGNRMADKIYWALEHQPGYSMSRNQIREEVFNYHCSATDLDQAFTVLSGADLVLMRLEKVSGSDKPVERWALVCPPEPHK